MRSMADINFPVIYYIFQIFYKKSVGPKIDPEGIPNVIVLGMTWYPNSTCLISFETTNFDPSKERFAYPITTKFHQ